MRRWPTNVAKKLGSPKMPEPTDAAVAIRQDIKPSAPLNLVEYGPHRFEGRKLGILVTDGSDVRQLAALT